MALARPRPFWLWLGLGALLLATGAALLGWAYLENQASPITTFEGEGGTILMDCSSIFRSCADPFDPTAWYVTGSLLIVAAALPFALAARRR